MTAAIAYLKDWQDAGQSSDCPLPDLYRQAQGTTADLTIGRFHDGLRRLHDHFGDWQLALAAYNAGESRVDRLLKQHKARNFDAIILNFSDRLSHQPRHLARMRR